MVPSVSDMARAMTNGEAQTNQSGSAPLAETLGDGAPALGRRLFRAHTLASFLLGLLVLGLVFRQGFHLGWRAMWTNVAEADAALLMLAFVVFYCSFPIRALRWRTLLGNVGYGPAAGVSVPSTASLTRIMYLAWFANCVTIARLGDAYRGYLLKKAAGVSFAVTLGTILAERLLDLLVLATMMGAGVLVVFGGSLPAEALQALAAGLILSVVGVVGLLSMRRFRWAFERVLPKRLHAHYSRLEHGVVGSFHGRLPLLVALSVAGWVLEGAALYVTASAVGAPVSIAGALVVALAASLLTAVPITPAGLGFTEAGMVVMLGWLGLDVATATAATLLFRVINYWSIVAFGFVLYVSGRERKRSTEESSGVSGEPKSIHKLFTGRS